MDVNRFIELRRPRWEELGRLLDRVEQRGLSGLPADDVHHLFSLYRLAASDLNWAQTQTGNSVLLDYLESTVARAYGLLAPPARANVLQAWWRILRHAFPATIREQRRMLALASLLFVGGSLFGGVSTLIEPDLATVYLPADHLTQSPAERVAELEAAEAQGNSQVTGAGGVTVFSSFLFTHNIRVCVLAFALGFTYGVGTAIVLFYNGAIIGCIAWRYFNDGVGEFFIAWVGPHGSLELPCIAFAGTAGLIIARAQWKASSGMTWHNVAQVRGQLIHLLVGSATLLVIAGCIEGGFSQINEPTLPYPLKITVAGLLFASLLAYLVVMPVRRGALVSEDGTDP